MIIAGTHLTGHIGAGSPPAPPAPGGAVVCDTCGNCSFSSSSYMKVTKYIPSCSPGLTLVEQTSNWPWFSATASKVRWQFDIANWIEYSCTENKWSFAATNIDFSSLPCVQNTSPGLIVYFASPCQGFEFVKETADDVFTTFLIAKLVNNVCVPSVPA